MCPNPNTTTTAPTAAPPPAAPAAPVWLSIAALAEQWGVHHQLIRREIASGRLRAAMVGSLYRINQADADAYMAAQVVQPFDGYGETPDNPAANGKDPATGKRPAHRPPTPGTVRRRPPRPPRSQRPAAE